MRQRLVLIAVCVTVLLSSLPQVQAQESSPFVRQGNMLLSFSGRFSGDLFGIGGRFGYFVMDRLMPGVSYFYTYERLFDSATAKQHDASLFLRYYLWDVGEFFPFLMGDVGYFHYSQQGSAIVDRQFDLYSVMGGGGVVAFLSRHFAVELMLGVRRYLNVPGDLKAADFDTTDFVWNLGFGVYL